MLVNLWSRRTDCNDMTYCSAYYCPAHDDNECTGLQTEETKRTLAAWAPLAR